VVPEQVLGNLEERLLIAEPVGLEGLELAAVPRCRKVELEPGL
jgi:hypothetical protein